MAAVVIIDGVEYVPKSSGHMNSGNRNSGHMNSGNRNSGNMNSGDMNSGDMNSGNRNSGDWNSGDWNSGDWNSGHMNSGDRNSGNRNSGDWNSGDWNSGDWNSGHMNSGFFCVDTPNPMFFDHPATLTWEEAYKAIPYVELPVGCRWVSADEMTDEEKAEFPNYATIGGYLKVLGKDIATAFRQAWDTTISEGDKRRFLALPNFDADKFLKITGVDVRTAEVIEPAEEIVIGGRKYVAVP